MRNKLRFASVCASFVVHGGVILCLIDNDSIHPSQKKMESIPIELVTSASLDKIGSQQQSIQTSTEKGENSKKQSLNESLQNKLPTDTVESKDEKLGKEEASTLTGQRGTATARDAPPPIPSSEPKKDRGDPMEDLKSSRLKLKPQIHHEASNQDGKEVAKSGKIARNESKTPSKSENSMSPASSKASKQIVSSANAENRFLSGSFADPVTQREAKVTLPNIPFDPEIFRAVAVPLPSPDGVEPVSYKEIVFGLLERAKHYPETALTRGAKGVAIVEFSLDSRGTVLERSLIQSSGEPDLDTESLDLVDRASPFPPPPIGAQHSFSAEIGFGLSP